MRDIKNMPFCWQEKKTLALIRENFKRTQLPLAISLYTTITEQASYFGKDNFTIFGIKLIEQSGIGYKSFREIMNKFIDLKILNFKKGTLTKIPLTQEFIFGESEILLLGIGLVQTCTTTCTTTCTRSGQSYKENKEEPLKENKEIIADDIFNYYISKTNIPSKYRYPSKSKEYIAIALKKYNKETIINIINNYFKTVDKKYIITPFKFFNKHSKSGAYYEDYIVNDKKENIKQIENNIYTADDMLRDNPLLPKIIIG